MHIGSLFWIKHTMLLYSKYLYTNLKNWKQVTSSKKHERKLYIIVICQLTLRTKPNVLTNLWCNHHLFELVLLTLLNLYIGASHLVKSRNTWKSCLVWSITSSTENPSNNNLKGHHIKYINPLDLLHTKETNLNFESNHSIFLCLIPYGIQLD